MGEARRRIESVLRNYEPIAPDAPDAIEAEFLPCLARLRDERKMVRYVGTKGDLIVSITHHATIPGRSPEPCMVLATKRNPIGKVAMIPLSHLFLMLEPKAMATMGRQIAENLYGVSTKSDCFRVMDALIDFAEDLKNAPPHADLSIGDWMQAIAEDGMASRINGKTVCD